MTFQEITARRVAMQAVPVHEESHQGGYCTPPEWQQVSVRANGEDDTHTTEVRQRCGGGYRILRKRIGGS